MAMDAGTLESLKWVGLVVAGALGIGISGRRVLSKDKVARARDEAEASIYGTSMAEVRLDRDNWEATAKEAWARIRKLERTNALVMARNQFLEAQVSLTQKIVTKYPELQTFLPFVVSMPAALDALPSEPGGETQ